VFEYILKWVTALDDSGPHGYTPNADKKDRMLTLPTPTTALVLVDLQQGIVPMPILAPRSGTEAAATGIWLAEKFRAARAPVVLVNVAFASDFGDALKQPVDRPMAHPEGGFPANFSHLIEGLYQPGDILVTKHQWGAFYGTDLDIQLRRRGVRTVVLGGIATNIGVESTARQAHEHAYDVVIAEDATTSVSSEMHAFSVNVIFPMLSRVVKADDIELKR
jgi:nicotinamidase-related amidase